MCIRDSGYTVSFQVKQESVPLTKFIKEPCKNLLVYEQECPSTCGNRVSRLENKKHFLEKIPLSEVKKRVQRRCKICTGKGKNALANEQGKTYHTSVVNVKLLCVKTCVSEFFMQKKHCTN